MSERDTADPARGELEALLRSMLEPDGYGLKVHEWPQSDGGRVRLEILATADACDECLVPKSVFRMILADRLPTGTPLPADADIIYPGEAPNLQ
jgi:hypothetical protein